MRKLRLSRSIAETIGTRTCASLLVLSSLVLTGCETDSFLNPSVAGYWETTPTVLPILNRLDIVERETTGWGQVSAPTPDDLEPGELQYRLAAGDEIRVEIFDLVAAGQTEIMLRSVDPSGNIRLPTLGEVPVGGRTIAQVQRVIEDRLRSLVNDPLVSVVLERGQGFTFVIYGAVAGTGVYGLAKPDFRLLEALALAGGTVSSTQRIYLIRSQPLDDKVNPTFHDRGVTDSNPDDPASQDSRRDVPTVDINELIEKLEPGSPPASPAPPDAPGASPGMLGGLFARDPQDSPTTPPASPTAPPPADKPPIDIDELITPDPTPPAGSTTPSAGDNWTWDVARQEWVQGGATPPGALTGPARPRDRNIGTNLYATRIIEIDYQALAKGEANFNVVVRPGDQIYVEPSVDGIVTIGGEITRVGVFDLPRNGVMTLSRFIDVAGGFTQLAIPTRVDLIRMVGPNREAVVRINLAAIRNRSEPDILLKPNDHIIIGTNFFAYPLAIIRNGFRMTYGFGFLLDRNFGNDVFGAPPTNVLGE